MYTEKELKLLQKIELQILKDFDEICMKNGIDYFVVGGTAIGAIRHRGFIPWDDDIDVGMLRKDFDKFIAIARENTKKYCVINNDTYNSLAIMSTMWSLKGTHCITTDLSKIAESKHIGIHIDIFCFDNVSDDNKKARKQMNKAWLYSKLTILSGVKNPVLYYRGLRRKAFSIICLLGHYTLKILKLTPRKFYLLAMKQSTMYKDINTKKVAYMFDTKRFTSLINKDDIYPIKRMKFENIYVNTANNVDKYLTTRYGNYKRVPKEEERHIHDIFVLNFGDYCK